MAAVSHRHKLVYFPIPKNGSSSLKRLFYELDSGRAAESLKNDSGLTPHDLYPHQRKERWLRFYSSYTTIAVVRDPIKRTLSAYGNRVIHMKALKRDKKVAAKLEEQSLSVLPTLNDFIKNLEAYRSISSYIKNHTNSQSRYIGGFWDQLTYRYPIERLDALPDLIKSLTGQAMELPHRQTGGPKIPVSELSDESFDYLQNFYRQDYRMLREFYTPEALQNDQAS